MVDVIEVCLRILETGRISWKDNFLRRRLEESTCKTKSNQTIAKKFKKLIMKLPANVLNWCVKAALPMTALNRFFFYQIYFKHK